LDRAGERSVAHRANLLSACRAARGGDTSMLRHVAGEYLDRSITAGEARRGSAGDSRAVLTSVGWAGLDPEPHQRAPRTARRADEARKGTTMTRIARPATPAAIGRTRTIPGVAACANAPTVLVSRTGYRTVRNAARVREAIRTDVLRTGGKEAERG